VVFVCSAIVCYKIDPYDDAVVDFVLHLNSVLDYFVAVNLISAISVYYTYDSDLAYCITAVALAADVNDCCMDVFYVDFDAVHCYMTVAVIDYITHLIAIAAAVFDFVYYMAALAADVIYN